MLADIRCLVSISGRRSAGPHSGTPMPPGRIYRRMAASDPIFIQGITERSGTNFLFHLLCLHPDCDHGGPIWENYLLSRADDLVSYVESFYQEWNPEWNVEGEIGPPDALLSHIGDGLIAFLNRQRRLDSLARLVTKSPSVQNLGCFFRLFPRAPLLIVVRDGRAVVESGMRSFGWSFEASARSWADAARIIIGMCQRASPPDNRFLMVRYEDLFSAPEPQLRRIFDYTGVDPERYNYAAAGHLPLYGSSERAEPGGKGLHWDPVERGAGFDPLARFRHWDQARHDRFNWIAGDCLTYFGYEPVVGSATGLSKARHRLADLWSSTEICGKGCAPFSAVAFSISNARPAVLSCALMSLHAWPVQELG